MAQLVHYAEADLILLSELSILIVAPKINLPSVDLLYDRLDHYRLKK